eukprot:gb/GECG01013153.1/.p1 GENE.gb/GECG01013153.1/~~gb/GECG01013153.1/.p1  ORF type:complete len:210 (+),score=30.34 gb/GECG01013153.1/:1-630(+)
MATSEDPLSSHTAADGHDGKEEDEFAGAASALMVVETGPSKGLTFSVSQAREIRIGRDKKCEASISDNTISRTHGVLRINEDGTTVFTDSSRNGTWYVAKGSKKPTSTLKETSVTMQAGDSLLMGHTSIKLKEINREDTFAPSTLKKQFPQPSRDLSRIDSFDQEAFNVYKHPLTQLIRRRSIETANEQAAAAAAAATEAAASDRSTVH